MRQQDVVLLRPGARHRHVAIDSRVTNPARGRQLIEQRQNPDLRADVFGTGKQDAEHLQHHKAFTNVRTRGTLANISSFGFDVRTDGSQRLWYRVKSAAPAIQVVRLTILPLTRPSAAP